MPPPLLFDLAQVETGSVLFSHEQIYEMLPHRHEFMLLDGVCMLDRKAMCVAAYADITSESWWVRGHVPGRPLLPGVLMLEMAAQTSAIAAQLLGDYTSFIGFGGIDGCKFRDSVVPPARLYLLCKGKELRPRRIISDNQGIADGKIVFEATITGLVLQ